MIDKQTINRESFLPILPKEGILKLKKKKGLALLQCFERSPFWFAFAIIVIAAAISAILHRGVDLDMDTFLAAMMMMPDVVLEWARAVPLDIFVNKIYLPTFVLVAFIFIVAKLVKPKKKDD